MKEVLVSVKSLENYENFQVGDENRDEQTSSNISQNYNLEEIVQIETKLWVWIKVNYINVANVTRPSKKLRILTNIRQVHMKELNFPATSATKLLHRETALIHTLKMYMSNLSILVICVTNFLPKNLT